MCENELKKFVQYFWEDQERIRKNSSGGMQDNASEIFSTSKQFAKDN